MARVNDAAGEISKETMEETEVTRLLALCPLDGRYGNIRSKLNEYFSEYALIKNRVKVEVYWLKYLLETVESIHEKIYYHSADIPAVQFIYSRFSVKEAVRVKEIEKQTKHDVKAVEYYVAEQLEKLGLSKFCSLVHLGCTSEDITNLAYANMILEALYQVIIPAAEVMIDNLKKMATAYAKIPMLAHTHGQPATPTTVGKELVVYVSRLRNELKSLKSIKIMGKFNGATGNYAAVSMAFPEENWIDNARHFVEGYLGLKFNPVTTQIENHDYMCQIFDSIRRFLSIMLGLDHDMWLYISKGYFKLQVVSTEVGSSTMPHKVNPINYENSEGNIFVANALLTAFSDKLSRSRMQRDLSDSTVQRYIGVAFGAALQAIEQTTVGLKKVAVNEEALKADLNNNWAVMAEAIQTVMRSYGLPDAYEQLKQLTRGEQVTKEKIREFIKSLDVLSKKDKRRLKEMNPADYIGLASTIAVSVK